MKKAAAPQMPVPQRIEMRDRIERTMARIITEKFQDGSSVNALAEQFQLERFDVEQLIRSRMELMV